MQLYTVLELDSQTTFYRKYWIFWSFTTYYKRRYYKVFPTNMLMNSPTFYVDAFQNDLYSQELSEQVLEPWIWIILLPFEQSYFCILV